MDPSAGAAAVDDDAVPPAFERGPGVDEEKAEQEGKSDREGKEEKGEDGFGGGFLVGPGEEVGSGGGSDGELYRIHNGGGGGGGTWRRL